MSKIYLLKCCILLSVLTKAQNYGLKFSTIYQYIDLGAKGIDAPWTIEMWVSETSKPAYSTIMIGLNCRIYLETWGTVGSVGITKPDVFDYSLNYVLPIGTWAHLAWVCDGSKTLLFVNGNFVSSFPYVFPAPLNSINNNAYGSLAIVDEIRVWNIAKTANEIASGMNHHADQTSANLKEYNTFDDQSEIVTDYSNAGYFGINNGGSCVLNDNSSFLDQTPLIPLDPPTNSTPVSIIPYPASIIQNSGKMEVTATSRIIVTDSSLLKLGDVIKQEVLDACGLNLPVEFKINTQNGDIVLSYDQSLTGETYSLVIDVKVNLNGQNYKALALGNSSLIQLLGNSKSLDFMTIQDTPDTDFRFLMIDVTREYWSIEDIKKTIKSFKFYKVGYLHIHLTDNENFMFLSKTFPTNFTSSTAAMKFKSDSSFNGFSVNCPSWGNNFGSLTLKLYKWDTNYSTKVANAPVKIKTIKDYANNAFLKLVFDLQMSGEYYWELSDPLKTVGVWKYANTKDPVVSYYNGKVITGNYISVIHNQGNKSVNLTNSDNLGTVPCRIYKELNTPYTIAELQDLELYAIQHGVTIIPELDIPGHSAILVTQYPSVLGGGDIDIKLQSSQDGCKTIIGEILDIFKSTSCFHFGTDESSVKLSIWG